MHCTDLVAEDLGAAAYAIYLSVVEACKFIKSDLSVCVKDQDWQ